jgi:LAO/AO transport system kinase
VPFIETIRTDLRSLARAASDLERGGPRADTILQEIEPHPGKALTIGITGPPGAGKSTLCNQLVRILRAEGKKVAVIAVDPSSPFTGGALLGDRIRMQQHHADPGVFIRSMASRGWTGGLARATKNLVTLFDAAGYDAVIIETVGVGQSEIEIAGLAQVTVVVLTPGSGDDVQSIKAGIMEIAQVFAINKADLPGAELLAKNLHSEAPETEIVQVVALDGTGIENLLAAIRRVRK